MKKLYNITKEIFKQRPLFLLLMPLFFIYSGYNELFGFLSWKFVTVNYAVITGSILLLYFVFRLLIKKSKQAALVIFFIALFALTFGYLHDNLKHISKSNFINSYTFLLPLTGIIFLSVFLFFKKSKKDFSDLYLFLNLLFIILLISETPHSIKRYQLDKEVHNLIDFRKEVFQQYQPKKEIPDSSKPDIYFIIFDALASSKSLKQALDKNNDQLDAYLESKGFYVAKNSESNYNFTIHSVSTTLNMSYLPPWIAAVMNDPKAYFWGSASILDNSLTDILKKEGYQIFQYQPIAFSNKDWPYESYFQSLQDKHYYFKTLPGRIFRDIFWNYRRVNFDMIQNQQIKLIEQRNTKKRGYLNKTKDLIKQSCSLSGKQKFVYGHFMIPHDPYVFDSSGNIKPALETVVVKDKKKEIEAYFEQVLYANKIIQELVSHIKNNNKKNTVIIIEGDHGYKSFSEDKLGYSFQNLNAFYFPDGNYENLYQSISPVNTFRAVLNKYYSAKLPYLKDSTILVTNKSTTIKKEEKIPQAHTP
jgi:Sulfatase